MQKLHLACYKAKVELRCIVFVEEIKINYLEAKQNMKFPYIINNYLKILFIDLINHVISMKTFETKFD